MTSECFTSEVWWLLWRNWKESQKLVSRKFCQIGLRVTVCKFQNFPTTLIFHEINFRNFRAQKPAILTHLEALNFHFLKEFSHFVKAEILVNKKSRASEFVLKTWGVGPSKCKWQWLLLNDFTNNSQISTLRLANCTQSTNFRIFLPFRFYVKSILENLEELPFCAILGALNFVNLANFRHQKMQKFI